MALKCFRKINKLWTLRGVDKKQGRNINLEDLGLIEDGAILSLDGKILWSGKDQDLNSKLLEELGVQEAPDETFFKDKSIIPAFVESHTHTIFAGNRNHEFEMRNQGSTYQEIAKKGGGILSTVKATREASKKQLLDSAQERVDNFLAQGVGTVEIKSGYGLDESNEVKMLQVANELKGPNIVATYLGPHAYDPEVAKEEYQDQILDKTLAHIVHNKLASRVDIFIEDNYYNTDFAEKYFMKAKELNLDIAAHVEQLSHTGGTQLAIKHGAKSVDHAVEINTEEIKLLAKSETTAVLLPSADFYLKTPYPKARDMIDAGVRVAVATDFNPGSSPTQDLSFIGVLARIEMKMSLPELIAAYSYNAACALGIEASKGALVKDKSCDFNVLGDDLESLFCNVGYHPIAEVWLSGEQIQKKS